MVAKKAKEVTMYVSSYSEELIRGNNHISYLFFRAISFHISYRFLELTFNFISSYNYDLYFNYSAVNSAIKSHTLISTQVSKVISIIQI